MSNQIARVKKPPAGNIITIHSWNEPGKQVNPKMLPLPNNSLTAPKHNKAKVNPTPIPNASIIDFPIVFFDANASALLKIRQLTTINEIKAPRLLCKSTLIA